MRTKMSGRIGLAVVLFATLVAGSASAYDPYDPKNCNGFSDWDDKQALVVQKVVTKPRVNFVKSPYDDDFKAENCPGDGDACRKKTYLVTGDLVLGSRTMGAFTCISYQSPMAKKQLWTSGWVPTSALTPVAPMASPKVSDWLGSWYHPGGPVDITRGKDGKLHIEGGMTVPSGRDFNNGEFKANVEPKGETLAFEDEGSYSDGCKVRLRRIERWLLVEDNDGCGGAAVSFTGLYRRQ